MNDPSAATDGDAPAYAAEQFPSSYPSWRYCIERKCGIPLTDDYIRARLKALTDTRSEETRRFAATYGDDHLKQVIAWFRRARSELAPPAGETA
jgi:hypothetical protein